MKHLYLIGGTMGVGKTTVCQALNKELHNSVFLDGDWCWNADPFQVNEETKQLVLDNIIHILNNFIHCSCYENIIFCWVMHEQSIIDTILDALDTQNIKVIKISLLTDENSLRNRLTQDIQSGIRTVDVVERSLSRLPLYQKLDTIKIDSSNKTIATILSEIKEIL